VGVIKELLLLPVAPVRGTFWVAERISDEVERERYSGGAAVRELEEIEEAQRRGELSEDEAAERQETVIEEQIVQPGGPP
jgi:Gas vesicle protein G